MFPYPFHVFVSRCNQIKRRSVDWSVCVWDVRIFQNLTSSHLRELRPLEHPPRDPRLIRKNEVSPGPAWSLGGEAYLDQTPPRPHDSCTAQHSTAEHSHTTASEKRSEPRRQPRQPPVNNYRCGDGIKELDNRLDLQGECSSELSRTRVGSDYFYFEYRDCILNNFAVESSSIIVRIILTVSHSGCFLIIRSQVPKQVTVQGHRMMIVDRKISNPPPAQTTTNYYARYAATKN